MRSTLRIVVLSVPMLVYGSAVAQSVRSLVNSGNDLYAEKNYADAEVNYRKALEKDITSVPGQFNLGNALYKQEKHDESITSYEDVIRKSDSPRAKAHAYFNMGDAYMKSHKYQEAVKAFTESLKLDPYDQDAKYNLSYALMKLHEQQNQQPNKNKKQPDKNQQQQNKQQQQDQQQQKQPQEQEQEQQRQQQEQQNQQQPKPQPPEKTMSKEDAERILDVLKNSEKEIQKKLRQRVAGRPKTEKDW